MTGLAGQLGQAAANTAFLAAGEEIFNKPKTSLYGAFTYTVPCDGQFLELDAYGPPPAVMQIVGSRRWASIRAYAHRQAVLRYGPDGIERPSLMVDKDKSGAESRFLQSYLASTSDFFAKPVTDKLLSNPKGIDGVSLLNDAHPYAFGGGTWDNLTADALSPAAFNTGIAAISGLRLENGEPAGFYPTHLICGPANRKMAHDLCVASHRPMPLAATGLEAYASVVAATAVENFMAGQITPIVDPRFADGTNDAAWILMDLSKPMAMPMIVGEAQAPRAVVVDDPSSENMKQRSAYAYYLEAAAAITGLCPFGMYGKL